MKPPTVVVEKAKGSGVPGWHGRGLPVWPQASYLTLSGGSASSLGKRGSWHPPASWLKWCNTCWVRSHSPKLARGPSASNERCLPRLPAHTPCFPRRPQSSASTQGEETPGSIAPTPPCLRADGKESRQSQAGEVATCSWTGWQPPFPSQPHPGLGARAGKRIKSMPIHISPEAGSLIRTNKQIISELGLGRARHSAP